MPHVHLCPRCEKSFVCAGEDDADCAEFIFQECPECRSEFDVDLLREPPGAAEEK